MDKPPLEISEDDARAGVTGHHVRYVLAFGLAGVLVAFAAIAVYFGRATLADTVLARLADRHFFLYALLAAIGVIAAGVLFGVWDRLSGRSANASQSFMRWRVIVQFIIVCAAMAAFYFSSR